MDTRFIFRASFSGSSPLVLVGEAANVFFEFLAASFEEYHGESGLFIPTNVYSYSLNKIKWTIDVLTPLYLYPSHRINVPYHFNALAMGKKLNAGTFAQVFDAPYKLIHQPDRVKMILKRVPAVIHAKQFIKENIRWFELNEEAFQKEKEKNSQRTIYHFFPAARFKNNFFTEKGCFQISAQRKRSGMDLHQYLKTDEYRKHAQCSLFLFELSIAMLSSFMQEVLCCGIAHNDVKPANIMIHVHFSEGYPLIECGMIDPEFVQPLGEDAVGCGSLFYCAPEQWFKQPLTEKSDVYPFGRVLGKVFGAPEDFAKTWEEIRDLIRAGQIVLPRLFLGVACDLQSQDKKEIEKFLLRMLSPCSGDRPSFQETLSFFENLRFQYYLKQFLPKNVSEDERETKKLRIIERECLIDDCVMWFRKQVFDDQKTVLQLLHAVEESEFKMKYQYPITFHISVLMLRMKSVITSRSAFAILKNRMQVSELRDCKSPESYGKKLQLIVSDFFALLPQFRQWGRKMEREEISTIESVWYWNRGFQRLMEAFSYYRFRVDVLAQANQAMRKHIHQAKAVWQELEKQRVFESSEEVSEAGGMKRKLT